MARVININIILVIIIIVVVIDKIIMVIIITVVVIDNIIIIIKIIIIIMYLRRSTCADILGCLGGGCVVINDLYLINFLQDFWVWG